MFDGIINNNKSIRTKAFLISKKHFKKLFTIYFLFIIISVIAGLLIPKDIPNSVISTLCILIIFPITVSLNEIMLMIWQGNDDVKWDILSCYRDKKRLNVVIIVAISLTLVSICNPLISNLIDNYKIPENTQIFMIILFGKKALKSLCSLAFFWLKERLFLSIYLLAIDYSNSPIEILKASYYRMEGNIFRHIKFNIGCCWWIFAAFFIMLLGSVNVIKSSVDFYILGSIVMIFLSLVFPYMLLCNIGFAHKLLPNEHEINKTRKISN